MRDSTSRGPTSRGPARCDSASHGPTSRGPTSRGPTSHGPTSRGSAMCEFPPRELRHVAQTPAPHGRPCSLKPSSHAVADQDFAQCGALEVAHNRSCSLKPSSYAAADQGLAQWATSEVAHDRSCSLKPSSYAAADQGLAQWGGSEIAHDRSCSLKPSSHASAEQGFAQQGALDAARGGQCPPKASSQVPRSPASAKPRRPTSANPNRARKHVSGATRNIAFKAGLPFDKEIVERALDAMTHVTHHDTKTMLELLFDAFMGLGIVNAECVKGLLCPELSLVLLSGIGLLGTDITMTTTKTLRGVAFLDAPSSMSIAFHIKNFWNLCVNGMPNIPTECIDVYLVDSCFSALKHMTFLLGGLPLQGSLAVSYMGVHGPDSRGYFPMNAGQTMPFHAEMYSDSSLFLPRFASKFVSKRECAKVAMWTSPTGAEYKHLEMGAPIPPLPPKVRTFPEEV